MISKVIKEKEYIMEINKITLSGFRNLNKVVLNLEDLIALISTNNYGKSNVLSGIKFGIDFINANETQKHRMMKWIKGIPLNKELDKENYSFEMEIETMVNGNKYIMQYGYEFKWFKNDNSGQKVIKEYLKIKQEEDKRFTLYLSRIDDNAVYKSSETGRCSTKLKIGNDELLINKLKAFDNLFYIEIINRINSIKFYIERHLDASNLYKQDLLVKGSLDELDFENTSNIPRMMFNLKNEYPDKFELLTNCFMQLFPEIKEIHIEELKLKNSTKEISEDVPFRIPNEIYRIMVLNKNLNQAVDFNNMSDGAKRIFLQLAIIIIAEIQGYAFVAIEEPENSIHPLLFQSYLRIISQFKGKCKIIITSHSPYLLKYIQTYNIYVGLPNQKGIAEFYSIKKKNERAIEKIANQYNISIGDYLFELINGTEDDIEELKELLEVKE